jgi:hypothetical protein
MPWASWPRYALRHQPPRPRRLPCFGTAKREAASRHCRSVHPPHAFVAPGEVLPLPLESTLHLPFLEFPCVIRPRRRREFRSPAPEHQAWRVPSLRAAEGSSPAVLPAGLRPLRKQVSLLVGSSHPTGRGWPHIAGRPPPLCRQGSHCKALDVHKVFFANQGPFREV